MRMPRGIIGLLTVLIVFVAAITLLILQVIRNRPMSARQPPAPLLGQVTQDISAELGWQNSGILLEAGETIKVQFLSGEIHDGDTILRGPAGSGYICGDSGCCEPMPEVPRDALIGRVGDYLFLIGDKNAIEVQERGELQLRINDCDSGLFDNSGSFFVQISP
jgi:hypothetical protein